MPSTARHTLVCSVLFLDIEGYSTRPVAEQLTLKERFNALVLGALEHVAAESRLLLDTGDGAAVGFLGAPEDALFVAISVREGCETGVGAGAVPLRIRMGINLGPVRLLKDINGRTNIIGDGINDAQRVMSFAEPGTILASRTYYEVVSRLSSDYARLFVFEGVRTDKHVREHAVYAIGAPGAASGTPVRVAEDAVPPALATAAAPVRPQASGPRLLVLAGLMVAALALGVWWGLPQDAPAHVELPAAGSPSALAVGGQPPIQPAATDKKTFDPDVFRPAPGEPPGGVSPDMVAAVPGWLMEMRRQLAICDAKGFVQGAVCAERVRWEFCAPSHWDKVEECAVTQGSKPASLP